MQKNKEQTQRCCVNAARSIKRIIIPFFMAALLVFGLVACGGGGTQPAGETAPEAPAAAEATADTKSLSVVATIFPEYDWAKEILGENPAGAELTLLLDSGVDLHSYQPTAEDIMKISNCDLFIYVGGESDEWVEDALAQSVNKDMKVINLLEELGDAAKEEEVVEGMQADEHEHEHAEGEEEHADEEHAEGEEEHADEEHEHEEGEAELDEHVWLSLKNAETLCSVIADRLAEIDPEHADLYQSNAEAYNQKLAGLDEQYAAATKDAATKTLLFGDRFPFRYLTDDYGLDYFAAFVGCSAETEASFETISFLSKKMDELGLKNIMTIEGTDHRIAETIVQNTQAKDQNILTLDSMQSVTAKDVVKGTTYLYIMEKNLEVLKEALQ